MAGLEGARGIAWNPVPDSENQIHGDDLARRFGFRGGLVPGVCVSAYLLEPAVRAWGMEWLTRGGAECAVMHPVYDGEPFEVVLDDAGDDFYAARLLGPEGEPCAHARVSMPSERGDPPAMRGDPIIEPGHPRPDASRAVFERLRGEGLGAMRARWPEAEILQYTRDPDDMPPPLALDGEGWANPAFLLGLSNWALAANVHMNPWVHLQTEHRSFAPIARGTDLIVEQEIVDLFEKKGHEFVDVELAVFGARGEPHAWIRLRAIYRLRGA